MRKMSYMKRAAKRFLEGTRCKQPIEAVERGLRTLEDWVDCLNAERELERQMQSAARHSERREEKPRAAA
jgi:hypothetical protein